MISLLFSGPIRAISISTLVCGVAHLTGCQKKADPAALGKVDKIVISPAALERVEKAVASYQKIVNSYNASGVSAEDFRTQTNEADFLFRDAIKFLQAKGISESFLGGEKLSDVAERWANYRDIFNGASERQKAYEAPQVKVASYESRAVHYLPNPSCQNKDYGWFEGEESSPEFKMPSILGMIELVKKLPDLSLCPNWSEPGLVLPESVMKEIRDYQYGSDEPKDFFEHFKKYCEQSKYGFSFDTRSLDGSGKVVPHYKWIISANLNRLKSAVIPQLGRETEQLDMKIKKIQ